MSDAVSIRTTRSAPPSYSVALQHSMQEEEPPRVAPEGPSLVVLAPQANSSTDTLVGATARDHSANFEIRGLSLSDVEARGPFTFSPFGPNAMLLLPHVLSSNSRPLYHISVSNDCFRPQICTTTIRRGTEQGQIIAEIQRSILHEDGYRGTVEYRGTRRHKIAYLDDVHLQRSRDREKMRFEWRFNKDMRLVWQTNCAEKKAISVQCTNFGTVKNRRILATFIPTKKREELQTLDITWEGRPYMDDIVVSCLVTEGRRTAMYDT